MSGVNWALGLQQGNAGEAFANTFKQGMQDRQQNIAKAAMAALVKDPNNQRALEALAQIDPGAAQQFQSQRVEMVKQQLAQHSDNILKGAQIIRQVQPKDQASWDQARGMAAQMGVDVSQVPQVWDENAQRYAQGLMSIADAFSPRAQHNPQIVPVAPGGGVGTIDPATGQLKFLALPNDGSHPAGAPAGQPLTDDQIRAMEGGQAGQPSPAGFR